MKTNTTQHQRGAATLVATVVLVLLASLTVLVVNKSSIGEQQRSGIDARSKEVYAAGNAALRYSFYRLMLQYNDGNVATPVWVSPDGLTTSSDGSAPAGYYSELDYDLGAVTANEFEEGIGSYSLNKAKNPLDDTRARIIFELITAEDEHPAIIEVTAPVIGATESHVQKTISMRVLREDLGSGSTFDSPPLVIEDCIPAGAVLGTPDITSDDIAIATITGGSAASTTDCLDQGKFEISGGGVVGEPSNGGADSLAEALFGSEEALEDIKLAAEAQEAADIPLADRTVIYVTEEYLKEGTLTNGTTPWHDNVGSLDNPVILFFAENSLCPSMNGSPVIYGVVYFEAPEGGCENAGSGAAVVFGTVAYEGSLEKINANIEMVQVDFGDGGESADSAKVIVPLPGSWRDFTPEGI